MRSVHDGRIGMSVAALARAAATTPDTVRYYERLGLLPEPPRNSVGYRRYGMDAVDRLKFVQGMQRLGLRLNEIADLLNIRDTGNCPCGDGAVLLRKRMGEIHTEITRLTGLLQEVEQMANQLPSQSCPDPEPGVWKPPVPESA